MNHTLDLFSRPPAARRSDPETSRDAAASIAPHAQAYRMLVLRTLVGRSMTDFELAFAIGRQQTSAGKRRGELRDMGLVREARDSLGRICKRPSPSGANAIVWEATQAGCQLLREAK